MWCLTRILQKMINLELFEMWQKRKTKKIINYHLKLKLRSVYACRWVIKVSVWPSGSLIDNLEFPTRRLDLFRFTKKNCHIPQFRGKLMVRRLRVYGLNRGILVGLRRGRIVKLSWNWFRASASNFGLIYSFQVHSVSKYYRIIILIHLLQFLKTSIREKSWKSYGSWR